LAKDFESKGPFYKYLRDTFYISDANADLINQNAIQAAQILQGTCKAGTMNFDLNPERYLETQKVEAAKVDCENGRSTAEAHTDSDMTSAILARSP